MLPNHPLRFGVIAEQITDATAWTALAQQTEALGYATLLLRDHLVPDYFGDQLAPLIALMAAAAATSTLRVGTLVLDNDFRHPAHLAKEAATLDLLSDGRFELGLGAGWLRVEYDQAGIPYDAPGVRIGRLAESVQIIKRLWHGEDVHFAGQHYQIAGLRNVPLPAQRPHPPLLLGGGHQRMLTLAGREADIIGLLTTSVASGAVVDDPRQRMTAQVQQQIGWVRDGAGDAFASKVLSCVPTIVITDRRRSATEAMIAARGWSGIAVEEVWDMPAVFIGSLDQIAADMAQRRTELGLSYYVLASDQLEVCAPLVRRLGGQ